MNAAWKTEAGASPEIRSAHLIGRFPVPRRAGRRLPWGDVAVAYGALETSLHRDLAELLADLRAAVLPSLPAATVVGRVKPARSAWEKMARTGLPLAEIPDLLGLRIIVDSEAECDLALDLAVRRHRDRICRIKDYIARPKPNGYRSLHATVLPGLAPGFELQVRTWQMHAEAERGPASHRLYKAEAAY